VTRPLLLVTRPAEEAGRTSAAAEAAGFATLVVPLLEIVPLPFVVPDDAFDALLITSARAPALAAAAAPNLRAIPAHAVGARTAEEAAACGFRLGAVGTRDGTAILAEIASAGARRVLHLAGEAVAPMAVPPGLSVERVPLYTAARVPALPDEAVAALRGTEVATLLFSARTAQHFRQLAEAAGLAVGSLRIAVLSPAVAEAAGSGWAATAIAARPDLSGMLAAAAALWQGVGDGRPSDRQPL